MLRWLAFSFIDEEERSDAGLIPCIFWDVRDERSLFLRRRIYEAIRFRSSYRFNDNDDLDAGTTVDNQSYDAR
jgi:hypothetical protein